jgi:hypothetical protein
LKLDLNFAAAFQIFLELAIGYLVIILKLSILLPLLLNSIVGKMNEFIL